MSRYRAMCALKRIMKEDDVMNDRAKCVVVATHNYINENETAYDDAKACLLNAYVMILSKNIALGQEIKTNINEAISILLERR
jgi:hypothetical protein